MKTTLKQKFAVVFYFYVVLLVAPLLHLLMLIVLIYAHVIWKAILLAYLAYVYYDHRKRHSVMDGNGWMFLRSNFIWKHFRDYFPIELVKTADLKPNRNYILVSFPHGLLGTGISSNMGNDIDPWLKLFPGIRPKIGILDLNFYTPLLRELYRFWGLVSVSKDSLLYYLNKSNEPNHPDNKDGFTANAVAILVGGAQEALDSHPGQYIITLRERKGFVKLAIETGSSIVPSFSFGEVDIYDQVNNPPGSRFRCVQLMVKRITGISPIIFMGRGFFQYKFGLMPYRKRIVQVVGSPIDVKQSSNPSQHYVNEIHQKVINALDDLFEAHKSKYFENHKNVKLIIQ